MVKASAICDELSMHLSLNDSLDAHLVGEASRVLREHHFAVGVVVLVADEQAGHHLAVLLDLVQPPAKTRTENELFRNQGPQINFC